jgi:hypothetical protein
LIKLGDIPPLSVSRFNRRLHALHEWLYGIVTVLGELFASGEVFIIDPEGIPVAFDLLPASLHDLTPVHELMVHLPKGATVFGDKGYVSAPDAQTILAETGVRLVSARRQNMQPNLWADDFDLRLYRKRIETVYSQMEKMGIQSLHARTNLGFDLKAWASLLALAFTNIID